MFTKSAAFYDAIYQDMGKDYKAEAEKVHALLLQHKKAPGNRLLDLACGTGLHLAHLKELYQVEGLDLDEDMLGVARGKFPDVPFHHASMVDFSLGRQFEAITCLFSSIGYVKTLPRLRQAIATMSRHLAPGGVLLVEPWFTPETWKPGSVHALLVNRPDLKIARMNLSGSKGSLSFFTFHYLVGDASGVRHFTERHELGLFTREQTLEVFRAAGLEVTHDEQGLDGRGLYIGLKRTTTNP